VKYLLDTCVVSELVRPAPIKGVVDWISRQQEERLFMSVLTLGELRKGIDRLTEGAKRTRLENWLDGDLRLRFSGRWLAVDEEVAERWGLVTATAESQGLTLPVINGLIAATALVHGMTVVTRNDADMRATGVPLVNPWNGLAEN
jgi:predicted nucleic acid-binding protein